MRSRVIEASRPAGRRLLGGSGMEAEHLTGDFLRMVSLEWNIFPNSISGPGSVCRLMTSCYACGMRWAGQGGEGEVHTPFRRNEHFHLLFVFLPIEQNI
ncbi:hypothetical protein CDAR_580531 [Caerostris darwini]|uniref:Uncharacterized protein n=1 Tax=Caerostris darwini TaxID=1538125 RepID=A0AAV4R404_9ARAC|nr:hypothetical protein CDAR_580531 [Caerostris darwini]